MTYTLIALRERTDLQERAAAWFHDKWKVPVGAYLDSMRENDNNRSGVPQWYLALDGDGEIAGGLGVIENDFHKRPDLAPNICAVYVEPAARGQGLSRRLLDHACDELKAFGLTDVYLITTHTAYYEHCGFEFFVMVEEEDGGMVRMYHRAL